MSFGTELLFKVALGLVVLDPKRLHIPLAHVARAKAEFDKASRGIKFQLAAQLEGASQDPKTEFRDKQMTFLHRQCSLNAASRDSDDSTRKKCVGR